MSHKGIFEDDSDDFESESGEDFSASEEEWKPGKYDAVSEEDEDDNIANESGDDASDDDEGHSKSKKKKSKAVKSKGAKKAKVPKPSASSSKRRPPTSTLRSKLFRRYNPPPKTVPKSPISSKVNDILSNSQYKTNKSVMNPPKDKASSARAVFSDSDSSDDDGLVNPNELDFNSEFFDVKKFPNRSNEQESSAPTFDCNAGMKLSDSSDDDDEFTEVSTDAAATAANTGTPKKPSIINQINSISGDQMHDFSSLQNFAKNLESAKAHMEKLNAKEANASTSKASVDESDITKLLSMGEGTAKSSGTNRKRKHKDGQHSDDSEWENVSDNDEHVSEIKDIQITVGDTAVRQLTRDQKKAIDLEACLKRRLNRDIKQKQVYLHKTSVLCWIAHGNYINRILNNMTLMEMCIKLLPSKNAYPKGDTDVKYYHMVTDWFHSLFQLKSDKLYCPLKKLPPKTLSLALQIQSKKIISKCDFVLLFVTMLRSLGIQCRLVINFAVPPQQPPQKDLFVISAKPKETEETKPNEKEKKTKKKEPTLANKVKASVEKMKKSHQEKPSTSTSKKVEKVEKPSESKATKSKNNSSSNVIDHSYTEKHSFDKVKVKLPRMSESFVAKNTTTSTAKSADKNHKSSHEHKSSQSPSSKSKKSDALNGLKHDEHSVSSTSPRMNGKILKTKNVDNAEATTSTSQDSPKKNSAKQSKDALQTLTGTPIKLKLADRINGNDVTKPFSPRKTRSKVGKVPADGSTASAVAAANVKAKTKLMLPQSDDATDANDKKKVKQPKKLNIETLNKNVAALLPGAKRVKPTEKTNGEDDIDGDDVPATERLVDVNRNRAPKNLSLRAPTRASRRQQNEEAAVTTTGNGSKAKAKLKLPQLDGAHDTDDKKSKAKAKAKSRPKPKDEDFNSDSDFEPAPQKRIRPKVTPPKPINKHVAKAKKMDNRVFSTDEENNADIDMDANTIKMNFWVEAYAEKEKKWITIDPVKKKVDSVDHVRKHASKPIIYVLAWNNDNTIRDVTPRYCSHFHTTTRKLRAEQLWIDDALERFIEQRNPRTIIEDVEFSKLQMDTPLPTSVSEFKNHPLYALERHLLKFEGIYPPNALTLGYIRNEPVYARDCVHTLHSREIWVKQARTVKVGEKPYKIVKARPKWNRMLNQMEEAKPLEIFGFWQTEPYQPPVAENGIVPRNPYGNVELFKPEMLPIGTRHIPLPNLHRVCKKMGVDCAQAVIGFDFHGGSSHPTFDGFVVCEEFADDVIKQWEIDQEEQIRKETEKREARVFGNWKKLIKGLLIRERLKRKFNFGADDGTEKSHGGKKKKESH